MRRLESHRKARRYRPLGTWQPLPPETSQRPGPDDHPGKALRFRSIWISDIHLGTRGCQAERLLDFLRYTESDFLYLVGDIVDGWHLRKRWYWPQKHNAVVQKILRRAQSWRASVSSFPAIMMKQRGLIAGCISTSGVYVSTNEIGA